MKFKPVLLNTYNLFIFFFLSLSFPFVSYAQSVEGGSSTQEVAFLFYKMTGLTPDYDKWVQAMTGSDINNYGELGKRDYISETRKKLQSQFTTTNPNSDYLIIAQEATLEAVKVDPDDPKSNRFINIYFKENPPFVAKRLPERNVRIIVPDLDEKVKFVLSYKDYEGLDKAFFGGIRDKNLVVLKLFLKPIAADADKPVVIDETDFYLLLTELEEFEVFNDSGKRRLWPLPPPEPTPEDLEAKRVKEMREGFMDKYK